MNEFTTKDEALRGMIAAEEKLRFTLHRLGELEADNARLRALVKMLAISLPGGRCDGTYCLACGVRLRDAEDTAPLDGEPDTHPHATDCPAFTPSGEVK